MYFKHKSKIINRKATPIIWKYTTESKDAVVSSVFLNFSPTAKALTSRKLPSVFFLSLFTALASQKAAMLSHRPGDYVVPLTFSFPLSGALSCWLCPLSHWECFTWDIRVSELEWMKICSLAQTHALLLESPALAALERYVVDKEMSGGQKTQCQPGTLPLLTAREWSDNGKR